MRAWRVLLGSLLGLFYKGEAIESSPSLPRKEERSSSWMVFRQRVLPVHRDKRWILILHRPTYTLADSFLEMGVKVIRIYAPEHGLFGEQGAGLNVQDTIYRGIPVISLYGQRRAPAIEELRQADAILFALRDVGVRHYTYLSTLAYVMEAAAQADRPLWVLDFPNPHAHYAYGPLLDSALFSFVGMYPIPLVPGLTIGEYARLLKGERWVSNANLEVIPWEGWQRGDPLPPIQPFLTEPPSPALRTPQAIELYPILGWYEATLCISVGRSTDLPFEQVGIQKQYSLPFRDTMLFGYILQKREFRPSTSQHTYHGWRIKRISSGRVNPDSLFRLGFFLLQVFSKAVPHPDSFFQRRFFDRLFGSPHLRHSLHLPIDTLYERFQSPSRWHALREKYKIYQ
ncbi:MAG: DUF1343 domain-containing protein [Bacteroidia bacterium]|nr:DUF1343 domain-containing protein [Bacteroidia bacterium]MDW8015603.1 DUF1343 domain-containing protein [Bacteroidia bacterium]